MEMFVKIADDVKRSLYLLGKTGLSNHFVDIKVSHSFANLDNLKPFFIQLPIQNMFP